MMRYAMIVGLCCLWAGAVQAQWGTPPANTLPMYGGIVPNAQQQQANEAFIAQAIALKGSAQAASDASVERGFQYLLRERDPAMAMKRFNQGYLLDPQNGAVYQGMAITVLERDKDAVQADALFRRAVASQRVVAPVYSDYGRFLLGQSRAADALAILAEGAKRYPDDSETGSLYALALAENGRIAEACQPAARWKATAQPWVADALGRVLQHQACAH